MMLKSSLLASLVTISFVSAAYVPFGARSLGGLKRRQGTQFITGPCASDSECALGCCAFNTGKCAGAVVAITRDNGCGFGEAQSNANAAIAQGFGNQIDVINFVPTQRGGGAAPPPAAPPAPPANNGGSAPAAGSTGTQFITGPCSSDSDCALGCCGFNSGKCAGAVIALTRDGGCGFGDAQSNANAAIAQGFGNQADVINFKPTQRGAARRAAPPPAARSLKRRQGTQFITGPCASDNDCALGCCAFNTGKCAGAVVALTRDGGCGFGDAQSNANAAIAQGFGNQIDVINFVPTQRAGGAAPPAAPAPAPPANNGGSAPAAGSTGTQFITGPCTADSDCALGCCGFNSGKCAGAVIALTRDGGCGFGDAQSNANAAIAQGFGNQADVINFKPTRRA